MGRDKAFVVVDGAPMRARAIAALATVCPEVVIVGGADADVVDRGEGPLAAIVDLLTLRPRTAVLIAATDQPRLTTDALSTLLAACASDGGDVVAFEGQPLPMAIAAGALPSLQQLVDDGERRLRLAVTQWLPGDDDIAAALVDVDSEADLAALPPPSE